MNNSENDSPMNKKGRQSFGPEKRVKKRSDFVHIQTKGRKWKTNDFLVSVIKKDSGSARLGITVTTKVDKRAVRRNNLKRRLREVFRKLYPFIKEPFDIVVIAHQGAVLIDYSEIKRQFNYALRRLQVLEDKKSHYRNSKKLDDKPSESN